MAETNRTEVYVYERVVILSSCVLSFFGSLLIICTFARWPDLRTTPRKLLVYLSVTDLLSALSYFYGVLRSFDSDSGDCIAQGAISTFANTSSFFWTVAIAIYLYVFIVKSSQRQANNLVLYFHLISWGVPFAITVAALSLHKIGYDASEVSVGWCWVNIQAEDHVLWMLLTAKIWEFIAYVTLPVLYMLVKIHIHRAHAALSEYRPILTSSPVSHSPSSMADRKLTIIPIIFIMLRMWSTIRFLLLLTDSPAGHNPVLVTLHGIGNTFQGAANCIMFVLLTPSIRSRLVAQLCCRGQDKHWRSESVSQNRASAHTPSHREENTSPQTWENNEGVTCT
ncbi:probable G-protein coupled receptor 157 [Sinocyclocheilus anshuiensis]|uniref:Probable G-protein coupled receptor 157 n=2 Tax=Sinocyclocheilus anshuiensis TaxID=1608454 RepID=A0A671PD47_9TELE|nr:PREDICTED: probable G-protein coupled receptor 157 [Sinocyclocheilus anshuiensis]